MENITIGQIMVAIGILSTLIGGFAYVGQSLDKVMKKVFEAEFKPVNSKLDDLSEQIKKVDMESCKNYLVRCLSDFENGQQVGETEIERFWEQYEHYTKQGGNSYIHRKVEQLKSEGKL